MGDLSCNVGMLGQKCLTSTEKPTPATSAYEGVYRCKACSEVYLAAGGSEYNASQLATFARIETEFQERVARGEVPDGYRRS